VAIIGALSPYVGCACLGVLGFVVVLICMSSMLLDVLLAAATDPLGCCFMQLVCSASGSWLFLCNVVWYAGAAITSLLLVLLLLLAFGCCDTRLLLYIECC